MNTLRSLSWSWLAALLLLGSVLRSQSDGLVELTAKLSPVSAAPGERVTLVLAAKVDEQYHAYGTKEPTNIPVTLDPAKLVLRGLQRVGDAKVPPGDKKVIFGIETFPLPHRFEVTQELLVPADAKPGELVLSGELDYQLCDENSCLPPSSVTFQVKLMVAAPAAAPAAPAATQDPKVAPGMPKLELKPGLRLVPDAKLRVESRLVPSPARAGESVELVLKVTVDPKYHAYGTKESINLPVRLDAAKIDAGGLVPQGEAEVPPGRLKQVYGIDSYPLPQEFEVRQRLQVPEGQQPGKVNVKAVLDYQLCDENSCDLPATADIRAELVVEAGDARAEYRGGAAPAGPATKEPPSAAAKDNGLGEGWLAFFLSCVGGGLFALVMPCTYPMIPITFSFFTKQADARGGKVLSLALLYGIGIVGMFTLIGALAGLLGEFIVPFAAHWITNLIIGTAFVVFGLSLLGLFTLQPPAFLMQAAGKGRAIGGAVGVLLMGATLVITSFTCTAPVVGLLLLPAVTSGDQALPVVGMAIFGLTMALPFVFLSLLPGKIKELPRSGEWMNTLKVSLGVVELAAAMKFFSNAEYAEGLKILPREIFFVIWILMFVGLAVFLLGLWPRASIAGGRLVGGVASLAFAAYCAYGALGFPLDFIMTALAPPYSLYEKSDSIVIDEAGHPRADDDYNAAFEHARSNNKLLLVNLTGFTCNNCRMVERGILPSEAIAPILREHFVEARLHMDNPKAMPEERWLVQQAKRQELVDGSLTTPTYVTVDPSTGKRLVVHVLSGGPTAWEAGYLAFLQQSLQFAGRK
jgi:thiol:disulfide interchange protein DsbD